MGIVDTYSCRFNSDFVLGSIEIWWCLFRSSYFYMMLMLDAHHDDVDVHDYDVGSGLKIDTIYLQWVGEYHQPLTTVAGRPWVLFAWFKKESFRECRKHLEDGAWKMIRRILLGYTAPYVQGRKCQLFWERSILCLFIEIMELRQAFWNVFGRSSVLFENMFAQQLTYYYIQTSGSELMLLMSMIRSWRRMEMIVGHMVVVTCSDNCGDAKFSRLNDAKFQFASLRLLNRWSHQRAKWRKLLQFHMTEVLILITSYYARFGSVIVPSVFCLEVVWCVKDKVSKKKDTLYSVSPDMRYLLTHSLWKVRSPVVLRQNLYHDWMACMLFSRVFHPFWRTLRGHPGLEIESPKNTGEAFQWELWGFEMWHRCGSIRDLKCLKAQMCHVAMFSMSFCLAKNVCEK